MRDQGRFQEEMTSGNYTVARVGGGLKGGEVAGIQTSQEAVLLD